MHGLKKAVILAGLLIFLVFTPQGLKAEKNRICLTMIVKNEGKIIERCLDSAKDIIDCISICDTGSTDNTVQIIEQYMQKNGIPGKVHRHEWKNFGHNRTLSLHAAQKTLENTSFPLANTYLLLLDADMMLQIGPSFTKDSLQDDAYMLSQKSEVQSYFNTRLLRASMPWHCVGVTHEYWACKIPSKESKLRTLSIDDRNDGGSKSDKFERDIKLLTQSLQQDPENVRTMFYLAESYMCLGNHLDSIKWYKNRIKMGGWIEEVWYSKYMIGQCYEALGQWDQALVYYLDAYQGNPDRSETLHEIARYYRSKNQNTLAYFFAKQGSNIPFPTEQQLFIAYPVYDYLLDEDISVAAYYTPYKDEGFAATNRLMLKKDIPGHVKEQAYKNALFYVQNLKNAQFKSINIDLPLIREGLASHFNPMNPSIRKTKQGYDVICRTVNYMQIDALHFKSLDLFDPTNTAKTRNFLVKYDPNFKLLSQQEITENLLREKKKFTNVEGLEDCRLFEFKNSTWFTCTTLDTNPAGQPQISLCKLSEDRKGPTINVEKLIPLFGPDPSRCEKNWLPIIMDGEFHAIYSFDPYIIYKPDLDLKNDKVIRQVSVRYTTPKHDFSRFSGSASPIEFDDGYLVLVHETVYDTKRNYLHRFLYLDKKLEVQKISKPFTYLHKGIEYSCGMALDHAAKNLIMAIGIEDREAYLCTIDLGTVREMLEPLPALLSTQ